MLLPGTSVEEGQQIPHAAAAQPERSLFMHQKPVFVTFSAGVTVMAPARRSRPRWSAPTRPYEAKRTGKNRTCIDGSRCGPPRCLSAS